MNLEGAWNLTIPSPMGEKTFRMELRTSPEGLAGSVAVAGETVALTDPVAEGGRLRAGLKLPRPMNLLLQLDLEETPEGLAGSASAGHMAMPGVRAIRA